MLATGRSVLVTLGEGSRPRSNITELTKAYGIDAMGDSVLRTSYHKYMHPKEALLPDSIPEGDFAAAVLKQSKSKRRSGDEEGGARKPK